MSEALVLLNTTPADLRQIPDLRGKVALCSDRRPGLITGLRILPWGPAWVGVGLDEYPLWSSRNPLVQFDSMAEWLAWERATPILSAFGAEVVIKQPFSPPGRTAAEAAARHEGKR